jgi:hypothetical protein
VSGCCCWSSINSCCCHDGSWAVTCLNGIICFTMQAQNIMLSTGLVLARQVCGNHSCNPICHQRVSSAAAAADACRTGTKAEQQLIQPTLLLLLLLLLLPFPANCVHTATASSTTCSHSRQPKCSGLQVRNVSCCLQTSRLLRLLEDTVVHMCQLSPASTYMHLMRRAGCFATAWCKQTCRRLTHNPSSSCCLSAAAAAAPAVAAYPHDPYLSCCS